VLVSIPASGITSGGITSGGITSSGITTSGGITSGWLYHQWWLMLVSPVADAGITSGGITSGGINQCWYHQSVLDLPLVPLAPDTYKTWGQCPQRSESCLGTFCAYRTAEFQESDRIVGIGRIGRIG